MKLGNYDFYYDKKNTTYAIRHYKGKTIKGVAKCNPNDTYSPVVGEVVAAARCEVKYLDRKLKDARTSIININNEIERLKKALKVVSDRADWLFDEKMRIEEDLARFFSDMK